MDINSNIVLLGSRVTIAYFSVAGLDVLGAISTVNLDLRSRIIEWLYMLQVHPNKESKAFCTVHLESM